MNILLADPDRDFLNAFQRLLTAEQHIVRTSFDGTQVIRKLAETKDELVILNDVLPRIPSQEILKMLNDDNLPVIVVSHQKINTGILIQEPLANAYLSFPFLPAELLHLIDSIIRKQQTAEKLCYEDVTFDLAAFKLCGQLRVTNEEIEIFQTLVSDGELDNKRAGPYINALNYKLETLQKSPRIRYIIHEGYRLVMNSHE